jgi:hypothetical protein
VGGHPLFPTAQISAKYPKLLKNSPRGKDTSKPKNVSDPSLTLRDLRSKLDTSNHRKIANLFASNHALTKRLEKDMSCMKVTVHHREDHVVVWK